MGFRLVVVVAIGLLAAACSGIDCGAASQNSSAAGACSAHTTFLMLH